MQSSSSQLTILVLGGPDEDVHADRVRLHVQLEPVDLDGADAVLTMGAAEAVLLLLLFLFLRGLVVPRLKIVLAREEESFDEALDLLHERSRQVCGTRRLTRSRNGT